MEVEVCEAIVCQNDYSNNYTVVIVRVPSEVCALLPAGMDRLTLLTDLNADVGTPVLKSGLMSDLLVQVNDAAEL